MKGPPFSPANARPAVPARPDVPPTPAPEATTPTLDVNRLLAAPPAAVRQRLHPHLEPVPLHRGQVLEDVDAYAYFPTSGLVSLQSITAGGGLIELATVANGGVIGLPTGLHDSLAPYQATVQVAGAALRVRKAVVDAEQVHGNALRDAVLVYGAELVTDMSKALICFAFHEALPRLCRWLLTASDRLGTNTLEVTQEALAQALGVMRPAITRVSLELRDASAIRHHYGRIDILNRSLLERSACACYHELRPGQSCDARTAAASAVSRDRRPTLAPSARLVR